MKRKVVLFITFLVLICGIGIMLYPTVSSLINARSQSRVIAEYREQVAGLSEEEIAAFLEAAEEYNNRLRSSAIVLTDPFDEEAAQVVSEDYSEILNTDGTGLMGYINIPAINVQLPVYHGTSQSVLARAVGHLEGTSVPVGGLGSHSVLSAHTGLAEARLFTDLVKLQEGDTFTITVLNRVLTYEIYSIEVVEPSDTASLRIQEGEDLCTLVTCTPYGVNSHRLLVHGTRIPTPETAEEESTSALQGITFSWEYFVIGGTVFLCAVLTFVLMVRRGRKRRRRIQKLWKQVRG